MEAKILSPIEQVWHHHCLELQQAIQETVGQLNDVLRLDDYHHHGHDRAHLAESLGPFGAANLDLASLSTVLGEGDRARFLPEDRVQRIQALLQELHEISQTCSDAPPACAFIEIDEDEEIIHREAEAHLNRMAALFKNLRMAQLEIRSKYHPATHDPVFDGFTWRQLSPAELRLCPPFLVIASLGSDDAAHLRKMMSLLESRKPIKILALRTTLRKYYPPTAETKIPSTMDVEMLPLALRGVYVLQTSSVAPDFQDRLAQGLSSPRPGVLSLFWQDEVANDAAFHRRAERALLSRTFPSFVYDPDRADSFVACFELSGNPDVEAPWATQVLEYLDESGQACTLERNFTFANFASEEPEFAAEFTDLPDDVSEEDVIPLSAYLELTGRQRIGMLPYVTVVDGDRHLCRKVASQKIVTQTSDRMHLWQTLQEFAGIDNPHVKAAKAALHAEFGAQQQSLMESLQRDMEQASSRREKAAVAMAVRSLVSRLTGVDASLIDIQGMLPTDEEEIPV